MLFIAALPSAAPVVGCRDSSLRETGSGKVSAGPNIVLVVWDAARSDRMSVYGHARRTTPVVEKWACGARVYDDCVTAGTTTVPSHASLFTGLLPAQHGMANASTWLADDYETLAELLRSHGYQTYLYSANPHVSAAKNFVQGFDVSEHPWDRKHRDAARKIIDAKMLPEDHSHDLREMLGEGSGDVWALNATGQVAAPAVGEWLSDRDRNRPFFVFLNYMEAHAPLLPSREYRERLMTPEQVRKSYDVDRSWLNVWGYSFGVHEYSAEELELTGLTYDAALLDLDDLFRELLEVLRAQGALDNTVVVLTSDHGEHLGEHHLLDHQLSAYEELTRVPLIVHYPARFEPGREERPVMNFDLFPTLLELARVPPPEGLSTQAVSLLRPAEKRERLAEYPAPRGGAVRKVNESGRFAQRVDPERWARGLRAFYVGQNKLIRASSGELELYDLNVDPREARNLGAQRSALAGDLLRLLDVYLDGLGRNEQAPAEGGPGISAEDLARLGSLGYVDYGNDAEDAPTTTSAPVSQPASAPAGEGDP